MFEKAKPARDAFTFSLRGMKTIAPFVTAPVIADDRINTIRDDKATEIRLNQDQKLHLWLRFHLQAGQGICA